MTDSWKWRRIGAAARPKARTAAAAVVDGKPAAAVDAAPAAENSVPTATAAQTSL